MYFCCLRVDPGWFHVRREFKVSFCHHIIRHNRFHYHYGDRLVIIREHICEILCSWCKVLESHQLVCCYVIGYGIWEPDCKKLLFSCPLSVPIHDCFEWLTKTEGNFLGWLLHSDHHREIIVVLLPIHRFGPGIRGVNLLHRSDLHNFQVRQCIWLGLIFGSITCNVRSGALGILGYG